MSATDSTLVGEQIAATGGTSVPPRKPRRSWAGWLFALPAAVMYGDYGCDDMQWLLDNSGKPDTIAVERDGRTWHLPVGRFDNRQDLTTFIRDDLGDWKPADMAKLREGMEAAFQALHDARGRS